jgi:hypothetical protein
MIARNREVRTNTVVDGLRDRSDSFSKACSVEDAAGDHSEINYN